MASIRRFDVSRLDGPVAAVLLGFGLLLTSSVAHAGSFPLAFTGQPIVVSGNLTADDDVQSTLFSLSQTQSLAFYTTSYAGGVNADGSVTPSGGFDPILSLFDANGNLIALNDDDTTGHSRIDPVTQVVADSYFSNDLGPGTYRLAVSEYDNFPSSTFSTYSEAGNPTFTNQFSNSLSGPFVDVTGAQRTSAYTYNIAAVPEASAGISMMGFLMLGYAALVAWRRRPSHE